MAAAEMETGRVVRERATERARAAKATGQA